ncbi:MAG: hypothetical protein MMC33_007545 [Icmadophila ericetorum]|nr:hypothetical protein [Icmadophila ericetorum]
MAEAVGLAASIISIVGAADAVLISLAKLKVFRNASQDLLSLNNEVADLRVVMSQVESYIAAESVGAPALPRDLLQQVLALVERANGELLKLDQLIHYRFLKSGTFEGSYKVFRFEWLKTIATVENHRQSIRELRQNIISQLLLVTTYVTDLKTICGWT